MSWMVCLLLSSLASPLSAAPQSGERPTIEELRRQLEEQRLARRAELTPRVSDLLAELVALPSSINKQRLGELQADLAALPVEAAPLLLVGLDPGETPTPTASRAAGMIQRALREIGVRALTPDLLRIAQEGSTRGALLAVELLGSSEDRLDAGLALRELWKSPPAGLGGAVADALIELDAPAHLPELAAGLRSSDPERVEWAVTALAANPTTGTDQVFSEFLQHPEVARPHLATAIDYFREHPDSFGETLALELIGYLGSSPEPSPEDALILDALPDLRRANRGSWLGALRAREESAQGKLLESIRICLARCGERDARRDVLRESEEWVDNSKSSAEAYMERARILMALRDYDRAANDYEKAYELFKFSGKRRWEAGVSQARALVLGDNLRQAAAALKQLDLTLLLKQELSEDPDFEALVEHSTYGKVLQ